MDDFTVDKARLDFARILVSTHRVEIVNKTSEILIDGCKYVIMIVEEWGCCLGEDAFLIDEVTDSGQDLLVPDDVQGLEEVQGEWELDDLVTDLQKEWSQHDVHEEGFKQSEAMNYAGKNKVAIVLEQNLQPILEPVQQVTSATAAITVQQQKDKHSGTVPWSLDWLAQFPKSDICNVASMNCANIKLVDSNVKVMKHDDKLQKTSSHSKNSILPKHSVGFIKRVACMPDFDRKQILKVLKRQDRSKRCWNKMCLTLPLKVLMITRY